jgi:hypothetical protein
MVQRQTHGDEETEAKAHNADEQPSGENEHADDHLSEDQDNQESYENGDGAAQGSNMGFPGSAADMNQMQMMMAMQNGMNPASFGGFPMMGTYLSITRQYTTHLTQLTDFYYQVCLVWPWTL